MYNYVYFLNKDPLRAYRKTTQVSGVHIRKPKRVCMCASLYSNLDACVFPILVTPIAIIPVAQD